MFKDTRSRIVLLVVVVISLIVILFVYLNLEKKQEGDISQAGLGGAPSIRSVPGEKAATPAYKEAVEAENAARAEEAAKRGTSATPTITDPTYQGPKTFPGQPGPTTPNCNPDELKKARGAGVKAEELRCKGCNAEQLKLSGYTAGELKSAGFTPDELKKADFDAKELRTAGFTADELKKVGFGAKELRAAGFMADELKKAGFGSKELRAAGFTADELTNAGFTPEQLKEGGFSDAEVAQASSKVPSDQAGFPKDCNAESLKKALVANISADALRKKLSCDVKAFKNAGYTADQLRKAGFVAGELKEAGFSAKELKNAGFSPMELRNAGFTAGQLKEAGFSPDDLKAAGYSRGDLLRAGFLPEDLKEMQASPLSENFPKDCSSESVRRASLANVPVSEIRRALGCSADKLKEAGYTLKQLKDAGVTPEELKKAGYTESEINEAAPSRSVEVGFYPRDITESASEIPAVPVDKQAQFLAELRKRQAEQLSDQERIAAKQQLEQAMATQASDLLASWAPPPTQNFVLIPEEKKLPAIGQAKGEPGAYGTGSGAGAFGENAPKGTVIKAGTVMFGVLETGINSDQESPILAKVIQGKLKGARLIGNFNRVDEKVLVSFSSINIPELRNTIGVNAVAIDPEEAKTALASRVDNHYFLRYGTLFASSFLSGLSGAISQSGSTVSMNANTGITVQRTPKLSAGQQALIALGNVGQQYASVLGKNFTVPPTVHVDPGVGIGILIMQDLLIPEDDLQLNVLLAKEEQKEKELKQETLQEARERFEIEKRAQVLQEQGQPQWQIRPQPQYYQQGQPFYPQQPQLMIPPQVPRQPTVQ